MWIGAEANEFTIGEEVLVGVVVNSCGFEVADNGVEEGVEELDGRAIVWRNVDEEVTVCTWVEALDFD